MSAPSPRVAETYRVQHHVWLLLAALSLTISSALFLHETCNRTLGFGTVFGLTINARAISCLTNILGVTTGFALVAKMYKRYSRLRHSPSFWIAFFATQAGLVVLFYSTLKPYGACETILLVQFLVGACEAGLVIECIGYARWCSYRMFIMIVSSAILSIAAITYGALCLVGIAFPLHGCAAVHFAIIAAAGVCFLLFLTTGPEAQNPITTLPDISFSFSQDASGQENSTRPLLYLEIILIAYGTVFGFLHVIPMGLPTFQLPRVLPNLIGAVVAAILYVRLMPRTEPTPSLVWNRVYRVSFPFVTLAALLIPYTISNEFVSSLAFAQSAMFFFVALLITGCVVVCRTIGVDYMRLSAYALLIYNAGFTLGDFLGMIVHDVMPFTEWYFGLIGIAVFLLLAVVTLNSSAEKYAKIAWGIIPKKSPKLYEDERRTHKCNQLADEHGLTAREREILHLLAQGMRPKEISENLTISITTVRTHVQGIYSKLNVHNMDDLGKLIKECK